MVLICKLGQFWFRTPLAAHMNFFAHRSGPDCWPCLWMGFFLSGAGTHQPEEFSIVAVREHECWPRCSPPASSICRPCCQGSSLSSPSHGQPSSQVTSLAQDPHLLCQTPIARRPHRALTPHSAFCLGSDGVGVHCGCCGRSLCRQSWRKARGSESGNAWHWRCSCQWAHPAEGWRSRMEARGLNAPAVCSGLAAGETHPWNLCTHKMNDFSVHKFKHSVLVHTIVLFMMGRRLYRRRYETF